MADETIRVFLLDDHEIVRRGIAQLLETQDDIQVVGEAGTAVQALELASSCRPDVAILDVAMPSLSGLEVTRALRERMIALPVILLTARARESDVREGGAAGADAYVTKPFSPAVLLPVVKSLLYRRRTGVLLSSDVTQLASMVL